MNLFGVYYHEENKAYELVFIGKRVNFINEHNLTLYKSYALDKHTLDYDRESFIVKVNQSCELTFSEKVLCDKNFLYTQLLKINKNININVNNNKVNVRIK